MADEKKEVQSAEKLNLDELDAVTGGVNGKVGKVNSIGNAHKSDTNGLSDITWSIGNGYKSPTGD